jgi:hypothetical protein
VVSDTLDPAPDHTLIASVSDYLYFVRNTNNIAYRNMDVVDMVPGLPGSVESDVRGLPKTREMFDLRIDVARFMPGAKVRLRAPAGVLDGAILRGLKLVARDKKQNIYQVLNGQERSRNLAFLGLRDVKIDDAVGFDNVLVEKEFRLAADYVLPDKAVFEQIGQLPREGYVLGIRQLWKGEVVGAVGIRMMSRPKDEKPQKGKARKARRSKRAARRN